MSLAMQHRSSMMESSSSVDIEWLSRDSCNNYIKQRRDQLKKDEEALELMRDELMRTQKETIVQGLCKLNKDVKKLSVKEFNETFGCDVIDLIRKQLDAGGVTNQSSANKKRNRTGVATGSSSSSAAAAAAAVSGATGLSLKTPAAHRMGKPPMTMRTARRGEVIKSL